MTKAIDTRPQFSKPDELGIRSFLPYGKAKRVRFFLLNEVGEVVDRCGVANVASAIEATFNELVKQNGGGTFTYELKPFETEA